MSKILGISVAALYRRSYDTAAFKSNGVRGGADGCNGTLTCRSRADDAALAYVRPAHLKLRLYKANKLPAVAQQRRYDGKNKRLRNKRNIHDSDVVSCADLGGGKIARIHSFQRTHPAVCRKPCGKLTVTGIYRRDLRGAARKKAVGESTGGCPDIKRPQTANGYPECVKRSFELQPTAADISCLGRYFDLDRCGIGVVRQFA